MVNSLIPKDEKSGDRQLVSDDVIGDEFSSSTSMSSEVSVIGAPDFRVMPYGVSSRLVECPLEVWVSLFASASPSV